MDGKTYIGDGVYVSYDGYQLKLETERENGTDEIYLDPSIWQMLLRHVKSLDREELTLK